MMIMRIIQEAIGTFVFLLTILSTSGNAIAIAASLAVVIFAFSGVHVNPVVSLVVFLRNDIDVLTCLGYIIAQVLGGIIALSFWYLRESSS